MDIKVKQGGNQIMKYYTAYNCGGLTEGKRIETNHSIFVNTASTEYSERARELLKLSIGELTKRRKTGADKEQSIYAKLSPILTEWEEQAAETALTDKIIRYCETKQSEHTGNKQTVQEYGYHEISNTVYVMRYHINDFQDVFYVSWSICTNAPRTDDGTYNRNEQTAGQQNKRFTDKAKAEKYIEGRQKAYAHLFAEINPPVPEKYKNPFMINGLLIKGYRLENAQKNAAA
jgi:hypothetical protein